MSNLTLTTPPDNELAISRTFDAPRAKVFAAISMPDSIKRWLNGPTPRSSLCPAMPKRRSTRACRKTSSSPSWQNRSRSARWSPRSRRPWRRRRGRGLSRSALAHVRLLSYAFSRYCCAEAAIRPWDRCRSTSGRPANRQAAGFGLPI